jgi:hypothetical protein
MFFVIDAQRVVGGGSTNLRLAIAVVSLLIAPKHYQAIVQIQMANSAKGDDNFLGPP